MTKHSLDMALEELTSDFVELFDKINFRSYDPMSMEFRKLVKVGEAMFLLKSLDMYKEKICDEKNSEGDAMCKAIKGLK